MSTYYYFECYYIERNYRAYYKNFIYIVAYIPGHTVKNQGASSYIPLLLSLAPLFLGHIGTLTLRMELAILEFC